MIKYLNERRNGKVLGLVFGSDRLGSNRNGHMGHQRGERWTQNLNGRAHESPQQAETVGLNKAQAKSVKHRAA